VSVSDVRAERLTLAEGGEVVIRDLDLQAQGGRLTGLTGPSGSGKTTVMNALGGLTEPAGGRLLIDGRPLTLWRDTAAGLILQNLGLVPLLTAHETVAIPLQAKSRTRSQVADATSAALGAVGLSDHASQLVRDLSGGQRQRVAVARALADRPEVILADEPTASLDDHWRGVVLDLLTAEARRGAVVIIASSDPAVTSICNELIELGRDAVDV
jgi:putative ABC transport system ATP-binding protein